MGNIFKMQTPTPVAPVTPPKVEDEEADQQNISEKERMRRLGRASILQGPKVGKLGSQNTGRKALTSF